MGQWPCERYTNYQVGVFVKASSVGGVTIYLQTSGGNYFAIAHNTLVNQWEAVIGVGQNNSEGPMFDAHVVIVVNQGVQASLSDVSVFEVATPAKWL